MQQENVIVFLEYKPRKENYIETFFKGYFVRKKHIGKSAA